MKGLITKIDRLDMIKAAFEELNIDLRIVECSYPLSEFNTPEVTFEHDQFKYLQLVQKILREEKIDFCFSTSGYDNLVILDSHLREYCNSIGIPFIGQSTENAIICYDKWITKAVLDYHNVPIVDSVLCDSKEKLEEIIQIAEQPIICKRLKSWSGMGQTVILPGHVQKDKLDAIEYPILVEKFINAVEISVNVFTENNKHFYYPPVYKGYTSLIADHALNKLRICPYNWGDEQENQIISTAIAAVEAVKSTGWAEVEMFLCEDKTLLVTEVNARLCGTTRMISMATDVNPYSLSLKSILNKNESDTKIEAINKVIEFPFYENIPLINDDEINVYYSKTPQRYLGKVTAKVKGDSLSTQLQNLIEQGKCDCFIKDIEELCLFTSK